MPPGGGDEAHSPPGPDMDDEESMDWWTKYFASVDAMIEVRNVCSVTFYTKQRKFLSKRLRESHLIAAFSHWCEFHTTS